MLALAFAHVRPPTRNRGAMKESCGLLMYDVREGAPLLVHPGGPFWRNRDKGAWSIPKGAPEPGEEPLAAACREFSEETGFTSSPPYLALTPAKQPSGKVIRCWACRGAPVLTQFKSASFSLQWPPRSGRLAEFPETDRAEMFALDQALVKIIPGQRKILAEFGAILAAKK